MKKIIIILISAFMVFSFFRCTASPGTLNIGTAGKGGIYEEVGKSLSGVFSENGIDTTLKNTAGSAANLRLLSEGYFDLAIDQEDIASDTWNGTGTFEKMGGIQRLQCCS